MIKVEPRINAEDYLAFQAMMPKEPAFKDAPTGIYIDFATFSIRENIRIQSGTRPNKTIVMVGVQPDKFEQYCENNDEERDWQSLTNFADAKFRAQAASSDVGQLGRIGDSRDGCGSPPIAPELARCGKSLTGLKRHLGQIDFRSPTLSSMH